MKMSRVMEHLGGIPLRDLGAVITDLEVPGEGSLQALWFDFGGDVYMVPFSRHRVNRHVLLSTGGRVIDELTLLPSFHDGSSHLHVWIRNGYLVPIS